MTGIVHVLFHIQHVKLGCVGSISSEHRSFSFGSSLADHTNLHLQESWDELSESTDPADRVVDEQDEEPMQVEVD